LENRLNNTGIIYRYYLPVLFTGIIYRYYLRYTEIYFSLISP